VGQKPDAGNFVSVAPDNSPIRVDIWSDVACPWCYIGKRNLEAGMISFTASDQAMPIEITYHSFELAPDTPVEYQGSEIDFLMNHRGVSTAQAVAMIARVVGIARDAGLAYDYDALQHTNTIKAHQLLHYAKERGLQPEMKERLLSAYFTEGRHVGRVKELADLAAEIGLDRADVTRSLSEDEYLDAVGADMAQARAYGINGVPFFVIDERYGISGAQPPMVFTEVLGRAVADRVVESAPDSVEL
jgi:predicted DsbA family dithiol-disulfide isomerase